MSRPISRHDLRSGDFTVDDQFDEPLATDEVKGLGKQAYFEWAREHGSTDRARWYAFLAQPGPDQAQATRIPDSLGCLVARWLQSGQEPTRAQIEALDP